MALTLHEQLVLTLATILRERREMLEISQSDLARRSGLHRSYIGDLERGSRNISVRNLSRLAHALGMQPSKVLALSERRMAAEPAPARGRPVRTGAAKKRPLKVAAQKKTATRRRKTTRARVAKA